MLRTTQDILRDHVGEHLQAPARGDLAHAQAIALGAVDAYSDEYRWRDVQKDVADGDKLLLVCYGERWRAVARGRRRHDSDRPSVRGECEESEEWIPVRGGDGCGLVYLGFLGHRNEAGQLSLTSYCPGCNKKRSALARKHRARVTKLRDHGFVLVPTSTSIGESPARYGSAAVSVGPR